MCWAKKCCFCINVVTGSASVGVVSFLFSTIMTVTSAVCLHLGSPIAHSSDQLHLFITKYFPGPSIYIIEWTTLTFGLMMMLASTLLVYGVAKKKPGFLLCFFVFGIFFTIVCKLTVLLLLLDKLWQISLCLSVVSLVYIHFLVVVHTAYDLMHQEEDLFTLEEDSDTKTLV